MNKELITVEGHRAFSEKTKKYHGRIVIKISGTVHNEVVDYNGFSYEEDCKKDVKKRVSMIAKELGVNNEIN